MENEKINLPEQIEEEKGASMLEYALMAALIAIVCIAAVTLLGQEAGLAFSRIADGIEGANP